METTPFWWEDAPRETDIPKSQPQKTDVAIVGAGFSGLNAAIILARAGRSVTVFESGQLGAGASSRNGGMLGPSFHKLGLEGLIAKYGEENTHGILKESIGFVSFLADFLKTEGIDADLKITGRFQGALRPKHYEAMEKRFEGLTKVCGDFAHMVPASEQHTETGSTCFCGGVVYKTDAGLNPAKYHNGLIEVARKAGVTILPYTPVQDVKRTTNTFTVSTPFGVLQAEQVAICTNGYTGKQFPWFRKRVLPLRSAIIATDPLPSETIDRLMPKHRMYGDSRRMVAYYRPSPDGTRILFGGRASSLKDQPFVNAINLRESMAEIYPELKTTNISHVWSGLVAYTFDHAPHIGHHDGMGFAMGYCGSGVARSSYFGQKLGHKMLGDKVKGHTAFDALNFETKPLYTGNPWFMPMVLGWHRIMDRLV